MRRPLNRGTCQMSSVVVMNGLTSLNNRKLLHLLSRVDIYSLYRSTFYVWDSGFCSLQRGFRYIEVRYVEVLFHTFYWPGWRISFGRGSLNRGSTEQNKVRDQTRRHTILVGCRMLVATTAETKAHVYLFGKGGFACFPSCIAGKLYYQLEATHDQRIWQLTPWESQVLRRMFSATTANISQNLFYLSASSVPARKAS